MSPLQVSGSGVFLSLAYTGWGGTRNNSKKFKTRKHDLEIYANEDSTSLVKKLHDHTALEH
jgi:hypothetical protein